MSQIFDRLKAAPVDLSKLNNIVNNDVVKKLCLMNQSLMLMPLMLLKTQYNNDKTVLENIIDDAIKEIPDSCGLVK